MCCWGMEGPGKRVCRFICSGAGSGGRRQEQQRAKKKEGRRFREERQEGKETGRRSSAPSLAPPRHSPPGETSPRMVPCATHSRRGRAHQALASPPPLLPPSNLTNSINLAFACTLLAILRPRTHACLHLVMRASHVVALMSAVDSQITTPSSPLQHLLQHKFQTRVQSVALRHSCAGARLGSVHLYKTRARRPLQRLRVRVYLS